MLSALAEHSGEPKGKKSNNMNSDEPKRKKSNNMKD